MEITGLYLLAAEGGTNIVILRVANLAYFLGVQFTPVPYRMLPSGVMYSRFYIDPHFMLYNVYNA